MLLLPSSTRLVAISDSTDLIVRLLIVDDFLPPPLTLWLQ